MMHAVATSPDDLFFLGVFVDAIPSHLQESTMRWPSQRQHARATGSERVDRNGVATATASLRITVLELILDEYAVEARFLSKVKDEADREVGCRES